MTKEYIYSKEETIAKLDLLISMFERIYGKQDPEVLTVLIHALKYLKQN